MRINKFSKIIIFILIIFIIIPIYIIFTPNSFSDSAKIVDINKGMSTGEITVLLKGENLIKSSLFFKIMCYMHGGSLKAGQYELKANMNLWKMVGILKMGKVKLYKITIPEGFTLRQIAELLEINNLIDKKKFMELCYDKEIIKKFDFIKSKSLEGFLFPDTYYLKKSIEEEDIVLLMIRRFNEIIEKNNIHELVKQKNINLYDLIKLASLVEKEAKLGYERQIISSVFLKRLKSRMKLESCASVLYALNNIGINKIHLRDADLKINSDFNTYLHYGLPATPICNSGLESIFAVLNPADTNYLYFVSKKDGTHEFSTTLEEHLKAKRKWK
ncbi:MAG: endolytic transglycosylase MltG [Candidatus Firestonebacteria bacterium]